MSNTTGEIRAVMKKSTVTTQLPPKVRVLTDIMLAVFRVHGRLLEKGDELVRPLRLTSARWQVLGAVALAGSPRSAPQIAVSMGMTRQGAQKQLNALVREGFFEQRPNPRHERSPLYALTALGLRAYAEAMALEVVWARALGQGLPLQDLKQTLRTLDTLYEGLDFPVPKKGSAS